MNYISINKKLIVGFFLFFSFYVSFGQTDTVQKNNNLSLRFQSNSFFIDNEYFNKIVEGYTLIGYWIQPELEFKLKHDIRISLGANCLKYSGLENYSAIKPTYCVEYKPSDKFAMKIGVIDGTRHHNMEAPLLHPEYEYTNSIEEGLQFKFNYNKLTADLWLNWEDFIFHGDSAQEKLTVGMSGKYLLNKNERKLRAYIPFQSTVFHKGGQIDISEANLQTLINLASGIGFRYTFDNNNTLYIINYILIFADNSPNPELSYENGKAYYLKTVFKSRFLRSYINFWQSDKYISAHGDPLFHNVSTYKTGITETERQLLFAGCEFTKQIAKGLELSSFAEIIFDINNSVTDFAFGMKIRFDRSFLLLNSPL